ncbi:MAG TPA: hypothetical protein VIY52_06095 [Streptosporangiaceae bacterium]
MTATTESSVCAGEIDSDGDLPRPFEMQSYADLLRFPEIPPGSKDTPSGARNISVPVVDAIVVPTFRSAEQISSAVELASRARCELLPLYTDSFPPGLSSALAGLKQGQATPLALRPDLRDYRMLDLGADLPQSFASSGALDISRKRNLGLLIGRMRGWTRVLLLDDDIRRINIEKLSAAAALLDNYPVVGLQVKKFPDASVVGHARRLTGRRQEPFISGGAVLVDPQRLNGFFPAIYHEDWLCIINHLKADDVAIGGMVGQLPYKPFATPERAKNEEFGEIFASALLWLVHTRKRMKIISTNAPAESGIDYWNDLTSHNFWAQILEQRAALLDNIARRLKAQYPDNTPAKQALEVARRRCSELTPGEFVSVVKKWSGSLDVWRQRLSILPQVNSVEMALAELGILDIVRPFRTDHQLSSPVSDRRQAKILTVGSALILGGLIGAAPAVRNKRFRHWIRSSA